MKHKTLLLMLASSAMSFSMAGCSPYHEPQVREPDNATYENQTVVDYRDGEFISAPRRAVTSASSFKLYYHNDDGKNLEREVWVWCPGLNGSAFAPVVSADGKDMTLTEAMLTDADALDSGIRRAQEKGSSIWHLEPSGNSATRCWEKERRKCGR